jgi:tRNA(Ile)-lysidine synthase
MSPPALAAVLRSVAGRRYPITITAEFAANPRPATLAGAQVMAAGRMGPGWLLVREAAAQQPPVSAISGAVWDGRFRVASAPVDAEIGALGAESADVRRQSAWPAAILRTLPAVRCNRVLSDVPYMNYRPSQGGAAQVSLHSAVLPAAGASFLGVRD